MQKKFTQFSLKLIFQDPKNPQKHKNSDKIIPGKVWDSLLILYTLLDIDIV